MNNAQKTVILVLVTTCIVGAFGIPLGDPKFLLQAFSLEFSFVVLAVLSTKNIRYAFIPNFIIAGIVIVGNTFSPKHLEIMSTLHPFYNAIVLIIGGYVLQGLLIITNAISYNKYKQTSIKNKTA